MDLLVKLFFVHLLADFVLQPKSWVAHKEEQKVRSRFLYLHAFVHLAFLFVVVLPSDWALSANLFLIALSHLIIDVLKLYFQNPENRRMLFFADQVLHVAIILMVWTIYSGYTWDVEHFGSYSFWVGLTVLLFLTMPSSIIIKTAISKWTPAQGDEEDSLQHAGKYIGILERLFVFAFVYTNHWEGIGFLLAAKSIFRFGDLKESKERKLTEYILIGTLISFGIAIVMGTVYPRLISLAPHI